MHYKGHLVTKKIPTENEISEILEKYREDLDKIQEFAWDWYQIGGRYGGKIKIKFDYKNEDDMFLFKKRNHKYFISNILDETEEKGKPYEELDYLMYMGMYDNLLYVDGGYYNDMIDFEIDNCYLVIDDNETLYVREKWNGEDFIKQNDFDDKVKKIDLKDKFITIIDFHD